MRVLFRKFYLTIFIFLKVLVFLMLCVLSLFVSLVRFYCHENQEEIRMQKS